MSELISHEVRGVGFGFYSTEEILRLSVKRITVPHLFDQLGNPIPNGLYDPALGPLERFDSCATCGLASQDCLGHLGHIELSVPCYQPLLFDLAYKLLKAKCFVCHRLKMNRMKLTLLLTKLRLIDAGLLIKAKLIDELQITKVEEHKSGEKSAKKKKKKAADADDDDDMLDELDGPSVSAAAEESGVFRQLKKYSELAEATLKQNIRVYGRAHELNQHENSFRSEQVRLFMKELNCNKCSSCGAPSPTIRKDGFNKIFRMPLTKAQESILSMLNIKFDNILGDQQAKRDFLREYRALQSLAKRGADKKASKPQQENKDLDSDEDSASSGDEQSEAARELEDETGELREMTDSLDGPAVSSSIEEAKDGKRMPILMFPTEVEKHLELLWDREKEIFETIWGSLSQFPSVRSHLVPTDSHIFFIRILAVPPSRFRPPTKFGDMTSEHPQNVYFRTILETDQKIVKAQLARQGDGAGGLAVADYNVLIEAWLNLQNEVNMLIDSSKGPNQALAPSNGIRQVFEKKEGLFRRNMMGKRVNFAARSVISPDPFINTNEIGVPEMFATQLTFPEPVTPYNIGQLRAAVINGPAVHPGANFIEDERGQLINLATRSREQREALSRTLLTSQSSQLSSQTLGIKRVLRHIRTGDVMLVNRQPTLHKPSMMSHKVRVLNGRSKMWQTIRMHYANCNTYNADFDGDEMNLHVPQNQLSRAEAYFISNTDNQYLVPTDGSPLRGLIQDNVLSGVLLTKLDTFLTKPRFQQLLYSCLDLPATVALKTPKPAIMKPVQLWTGKQVISSILEILTQDRPALNLNSNAKIPVVSWNQHRSEATIIIRGNELCTGALDKSQFGDAGFGLVHAVFELYGPETAGRLLSILGRLFTLYLQGQGFTCGIDDMLLVPTAEATRRKMMDAANVKGIEAAAHFAEVALDVPVAQRTDQPRINVAIQQLMKDPKNGARLDNAVKSVLNPFTGEIIKACLPGGQVKSFPINGMSLMTLSGAKGSNVNFSQISCCLGQQELEGRRVPLMASGKSLPCFRKYDPAPIAGGYVAHRFLTGVPPSSYFFHSMAGREGLIDTAVKTSRSGYLQRCLIKHLESLCVQYDYTVRDSDASVVQFHYGEDSIDVGKTAYLEDFSFLTSNYRALVHKLNPVAAVKAVNTEAAMKYLDKQKAKAAKAKAGKAHAYSDPVMDKFNPGRYLGAVSDAFQESIENFISADKDQLFSAAKASPITPDKFRALMRLNYLFSLVHPGESVGILAAQSIGEPSTQMTLNTFHLAGHGGANVTLGIPRLREIIMTASAKIKTPICEVPLRPGVTRQQAEEVANRLNRVHLPHFIVEATSRESLEVTASGVANRLYTVRLEFPPMNSKPVQSNGLTPADFKRCFSQQFLVKLNAAVAKQVKILSKSNAATPVILRGREQEGEAAVRKRTRRAPNSEDGVKASEERAKHSEAISYDEPDSDDEDIIREEDSRRRKEEEDEDESDREDSKSKKGQEAEEDGQAMDDGDKPAAAAGTDASFSRAVLAKCLYIRDMRYSNTPAAHYAELVVGVSLSMPKLLMISEVETVIDSCLLRATNGINKSVLIERKKKDTKTGETELILQTDGINFQEMAKYGHLFDLTQLYSNDIAAILNTYGVEAARAAITKEVNAVFGVYGISVDLRHLGLIADYMTFSGGYKPLNRGGIDSNTSTFQKISFETSIGFLKDACLLGDFDHCSSPSSNIVIGKPPKCGTGAFQLLQPLFAQ